MIECCFFSLYQIFPARAPGNGTDLMAIQGALAGVEAGEGRTAGVQAGFQMAALAVTLLIAIISGSLVGMLTSYNVCLLGLHLKGYFIKTQIGFIFYLTVDSRYLFDQTISNGLLPQ